VRQAQLARMSGKGVFAKAAGTFPRRTIQEKLAMLPAAALPTKVQPRPERGLQRGGFAGGGSETG